jgi:hypothetical protein
VIIYQYRVVLRSAAEVELCSSRLRELGVPLIEEVNPDWGIFEINVRGAADVELLRAELPLLFPSPSQRGDDFTS